MSPVLTDAGPAHAGVIAALHGACFETPWDERAVADILAMPGAGGLLAGFDADNPGAFVLYRRAADEGEIISIGVIPEGRRKGLARALLGAMLGRLGEQGVARLFLEVDEHNAAARAFYEKAGFTAAGRRAGYYGRGKDKSDAVVYALKVNRK